MDGSLRTMTVALLLTSVMLLSACGAIAQKATETAVEKATGVQVDKEGESFTVTTEEGQTTASTGNVLPEGFPKDVPVYKNAKVESSVASDASGGKAYVIGLKSEDSLADISKWYAAQIKDNGWKDSGSMQTDDFASMSAEKGDLLLGVTLTPESDTKTTVIALTVSPKQ